MIELVMELLPARQRRALWAFIAATAIQGVLQALGFLLLLPVFEAVLDGDLGRLGRWVALIVGIVVVHHLMMWFATGSAYEIAGEVIFAQHRRIGEQIARLPIGWFGAERTGPVGRMLSKASVDIGSLLAHMLRPLIIGLVAPPAFVVGLFVIHWRLGLVLFAGMVTCFAAWRLHMWIIAANEARFDSSIAVSAGRIVEFARNQPVFRAFGVGRDLADVEGSALAAALTEQQQAQRVMTIRGAVGLITFMATLQLSLVAVILVGVRFCLDGSLSLAALLTVIVVALRMTEPISALAETGGMVQIAVAGLGRVQELMDEPLLPEPDRPAHARGSSVEFDEVTFGYGDEPTARPVLDHVSFTAPERGVTAIVGPSGSGKTTLLKLAARFMDVDSGAVRIGGADVRDLGTAGTIDLITPVFQDVYLFEGTIAENLRMAAPDCSEAELHEAARIARVDEIVERLPQGWDTRIGEGGSTLSGGEKQRVSIARALLKDAPVELLDEATAALDPINEAAVGDALRELARTRTVLVVAHRLQTVAGADRIVVLDGGRVVEQGTHAELHAAGGRYRSFWNERERASGWRLA